MPRGIAQDDSSRLFVVDTTDHMVRVYTVGDKAAEAPTYVGSIGGEGRADATFEYPNGLAVDKRAHIYVTDRENNRVQVWGY
jgi:sugar lactone lactonase YvrE